MKITRVEVKSLELPARDPHAGRRRPGWLEQGPIANPLSRYRSASSNMLSWVPEWPDFLVVVTAEDGTQGVGPGRYGRPVAAVIREYLGPRVIGEPALATERLYDMLVRLCAPFGATGLASYAISGVDLALWDLKGKVLGKPVYQLIGGPARDFVECYATCGDADWAKELGFTAVKVPCRFGPIHGRGGLQRNFDSVAAARECLGDVADLMLDCWMALDVDYGVRLAESLRPLGLAWIEEMLRPEDFDGYAQLRTRLPWQKLATGEHWYTPFPFQHAASRRLVDILQPDIAWVGGLTPLLKICAIADAAGLAVIPHGGATTPYGQHAVFALPAIPLGEWYIATAPGVPLENGSLLPGTAVPRNGRLRPSDAPGFGVEINAAKMPAFL